MLFQLTANWSYVYLHNSCSIAGEKDFKKNSEGIDCMAIVYHPKPTDVPNMVVFISANKYHPLVYTTQVNGVLNLH